MVSLKEVERKMRKRGTLNVREHKTDKQIWGKESINYYFVSSGRAEASTAPAFLENVGFKPVCNSVQFRMADSKEKQK